MQFLISKCIIYQVALIMCDISAAAKREQEDNDLLQQRESIQAVAWLQMIYEDSDRDITLEKAHRAATVIQVGENSFFGNCCVLKIKVLSLFRLPLDYTEGEKRKSQLRERFRQIPW